MATTRQQLIRDFTQHLKTRGLRIAGLGAAGVPPGAAGVTGGTGSDHYRVYTHVAGNLAAPASTTFRIVIDLSQAILDAMGEKATGAENSVIPIPDRV